MSVIRIGHSFIRSVLKHLPTVKGSGKAPVKSGLCIHEIKQDNNVAAKQLVVSFRVHQNINRGLENAGFLARSLWKVFRSRAGCLVNSQAAFLRRETAVKLLQRCGSRSPMFAFLGFAYANNNVNFPKDIEEREHIGNLHKWIQDALWNTQKQEEEEEQETSHAGLKLQDYEIGERLGENSSNSAVYGASHMGSKYAIKMLFNFGAASQSTSLYQEFAKECQVLCGDRQPNTVESGPTYTSLPHHPHIAPVLHAFTDDVPCLPDAMGSYPAALPSVYGDGCFGRNRTLFLVMPRYNRTLQDYSRLPHREQNPRVSSFLLVQLLEGVAHLTKHGVAHRDLKTDNILLDESFEGSCPRLVIADFGCCLADRRWGLRLPFISEEVNRGGNAFLMAPEIATAVPGEHSVLDYTKSDAWAAGAIAYEIFGEVNPFSRARLDSRTYHDHQLPSLTRAPEGVRKVVLLLLKRDQSERVSANTAANMIHLLLWAPPHWLGDVRVTVNDVIRWLLRLSVQVLVRRTAPSVEDKVLNHFLCRASVEEIMKALDQFKDRGL